MSIKLGGSKSKSSFNNTNTASSTTTPLAPDWASSLTQRAAGRVGGLMDLDPQDLIAPTQALHVQGADDASRLRGSPWNFDSAADLTRGVADTSWLDGYMQAPGPQIGPASTVDGASLLDNLEAYTSPYTRDVVDAALADFDFAAANTRAQQDLDLAASGAFGGSGAALTRSMTEDALTRGRGSTSANLRDQAFMRAAALASEDAARRQQAQALNAQIAMQQMSENARLASQDAERKAGWGLAAGDQRLRAADQLVGLSTAYDANQRANIATQAELADTLRDIDQQQRQAPVASSQQIVAMLSGLPIGLFTGEHKTATENSSGTSKGKNSDWGLAANVKPGGWLGKSMGSGG